MGCDRGEFQDIALRSATTSDVRFVVEMARYACVIEDRPLPDSASEETQSLLPGIDDIVVVAAGAAGARLGAAWTFRNDPPLIVDADGVVLPEVAVAVVPESRGRGVGGALLDELVTRSSAAKRGLSLNVHVRNPALRLYERKGFRTVGQGRGTFGIAMRIDIR
jgi:GNAT superfamily N-acetyltransferase